MSDLGLGRSFVFVVERAAGFDYAEAFSLPGYGKLAGIGLSLSFHLIHLAFFQVAVQPKFYFHSSVSSMVLGFAETIPASGVICQTVLDPTEVFSASTLHTLLL